MMQRIRGLDGIRGLSAIAVVITHLSGWDYLEQIGLLSSRLTPLINGSAGVQAFFILSGFLISLLLVHEYRRTGTISIRKFIWRRALRIFPLYYLFLLIATGIFALDNRVTSPGSLAYAYAYMYNFVPKSLYTPFLGHTWSLAVEEHFYLIWPVTFLLLWKRSTRLVTALLSLSIAGSLVIHLWLLRTGNGAGYFVERWTFVSGYGIALGCLLAILLSTFGDSKIVRAAFTGGTPLVLATGLFAVSVVASHQSWTLDHTVIPFVRCLGLALLIGWVYLNQSSMAVRLLEWPPLAYCGVISYGIYMYQGLFLATGPNRVEDHTWPPDQRLGLLLLAVSAPLSFHLFEQPFIRLKGRFQS